MKIFIETSVFIRYFTRDDESKYRDCEELLRAVEEGRIKPYTSSIVVAEIVFVLVRLYGFSKQKVLGAVKDLLAMRNLVLIERTDTRAALALFESRTIKYGDCLIAAQVPAGVTIITYDEEMKRIPRLSAISPAEFQTN